MLCPTTRQPFFFISGPQAQSTQQRKICCCRCFFTPQKGEEAPISTPADRCRMPASRNWYIRVHIFCAIDISVQRLPSGLFKLLFVHNVCNVSTSWNGMFTKLLQNSTFPLWCIPVFYAKWRSIHVAQFFEPSLFISAKASILARKQEQYLYVFCSDICNLRLSFWLLFCYHNCIQRGMCRPPVRDDVFCI